MHTRGGVFWYSLGLTLLLLLPMVGVTAFLVRQRQQQNALRQAAAGRGGIAVEQGAQDTWRLLLVVQQEEPAFVLARADGPAQTVTLCALPGALQVDAPSGTTTLAACAQTAGPGRAVQLLGATLATGESAAPPLYYLAATPDCWADCAGVQAAARLDTAALLTAAQRRELGYGQDSVAQVDAAGAAELIARLQSVQDDPDRQAAMRAAVWEAFARQDPALLAALPDAWRQASARTLTDLLAGDLAGAEATLQYLAGQPGLTVQYTTAPTQDAGGGEVTLTQEGRAVLAELLQ